MAVCAAWFGARAAEEEPLTVALDRTPVAVQRQIKTQLGDGTLDDIELDVQDGETNYTANLTRKDGEERYFTLAEDGTVLGIQVNLKELPGSIAQAIKAQLGAGTLDSVEKTFDEGEISYDVSFTRKDGVERSFTVDAKGALTSIQLGLDEIPEPVRKTIEGHAETGTPDEIHKLIEDGEISYSAELRKNGKVREIVISPQGKTETLQKFLDEVPGPAQKTIQEKAGSGKILRIDRSFTRVQGVEPFRVEVRKDGKLMIFNVGPKGRFLGLEE